VGATVNLTTPRYLTLAKALTATSYTAIGNTTGNDLAIGEIATYQLTVTVEEGTTADITLTDTVPAGLQYVAGTAYFRSADSVTALGNVSNTAYSNLAGGVQIAAGDITTNTTGAAAGSLVFQLKTIVALGTSGLHTKTFVIEYQLLALNDIGNANNGTRLNSAVAVSTALGITTAAATQTATIKEPALTLAKNLVTARTGIQAGDPAVYDLVISNAAGASTAYDLVIADILHANLELVAPYPSMVVLQTPPTGNYATLDTSGTTTASVVNATLTELRGGDSVTLRITTQVKLATLAKQIITNTASLTYTSLPGTPSAPSVERTGTGGAPNTYTTSDSSDAFALGEPSIDKSFKNGAATTDATSVLSTSGANVVIGEQVTYDILVKLPKATTETLTVIDTLPVGLRFDSWEIITATGSAPGQSTLLSASFDGTAPHLARATLSRAADFALATDFVSGKTVCVTEGAAGASKAFALSVTVATLNTDPVTWGAPTTIAAARVATTATIGTGFAANQITGVALSLDGVTLAVGNRVLVKDQAASAQNGVYVVTSIVGTATLTRATDFALAADFVSGKTVGVTEGTLGASKAFALSAPVPILNTDPVTWVETVPAAARVATTASIGAFAADHLTGVPANIDGVSLALGNRVLVKNQATPSQNGVYVVESFEAVVSPDVGGVAAQDGLATLTFNFGDTAAVGDFTSNSFVLRLVATVLNIDGNQTAITRANTATMTYTDPNNHSTITMADGASGNDPEVTVVEPTLTVAKVISSDNVTYGTSLTGQDAGNPVYYKLTLTNGSALTDTRAYDITLANTLPAVFTPDPTTPITVTSSGSVYVNTVAVTPAATDFTRSGNVLSVKSGTAIDLDAGATLTLVLKGKLAIGTTPKTTYTDTAATLTWTSISGASGDERTGSGTGPNDYSASSGTVTVTTTVPTFAKTLESTATPSIGDLVTYNLTMTVPEGTTQAVTIVDTLAAGLTFKDVVSVTLPTNVTTANTIGTGSGASAGTGPTNVTLADVSGGIHNQATFNLGNVVNSNIDNVARQIVIQFRAVVLDITAGSAPYGNQADVVLNNAAALSYTTDGGTPLSSNVDVTLIEPTLTLTQTVSNALAGTYGATATGLDAGDRVYFKVNIVNTYGALDATAYDLFLKVALSATYYDTPQIHAVTNSAAGLYYVDNASTTPAVGYFAFVGNTLGVTSGHLIALGKDTDLTITFSARLANAVTPAQVLSNLATIRWSSVDQSPENRSIHNAASDARTGGGAEPAAGVNLASDQTILNNYAASSGLVSFTTNSSVPTLTKALTDTSHKTIDGATSGNNLAIGETATYQLTVTVAQGTTGDMTITDTVPTGLQYVAATATFISTDLVTANVGGAAYSNGQTIAGGHFTNGTSGATGGGNLVFALTNIVAPGAVGLGTKTFVIEYQLVAMNIVGNSVGTTRQNSAVAVSTALGTTTAASTQTVTLQEPSLTLTKTVITAGADAGDPVVYEVTITNSSAANTSTAYDLIDGYFRSHFTSKAASACAASASVAAR
jgi:fimbrial isopeptide formation D2 family protein